jgi:MFS family permease
MAVILLSRTALNIAFRIVYPYLPAISRGLDIPLSFATQLITLRILGLMAAPFLGLLSDRYGRNSPDPQHGSWACRRSSEGRPHHG